MEISGRLIKEDKIHSLNNIDRFIPKPSDYYEATIELPPIDISKIKEGDEVWVKTKVIGFEPNNKADLIPVLKKFGDEKDIIVHFPQPSKPEAKLPEKLKGDWVNDGEAIHKLCVKVDDILDYLKAKELEDLVKAAQIIREDARKIVDG